MNSLTKNIFKAPSVKVDTKERTVEYSPRSYTQFIQGLKKKELTEDIGAVVVGFTQMKNAIVIVPYVRNEPVRD